MPNPRLLNLMMSCIGGTLLGAAVRPLGTPMVILASLFGAMAGWVFSRWLIRKIF